MKVIRVNDVLSITGCYIFDFAFIAYFDNLYIFLTKCSEHFVNEIPIT